MILLYQRISTNEQDFQEQNVKLSRYRSSQKGEQFIVIREIRCSFFQLDTSKLYRFLNSAEKCRSIDQLVITRIDRLTRSLGEGLILWRLLKRRRITLVVLNIPNWKSLSDLEQLLLFVSILQVKEVQYLKGTKG